MTENTKLQGDVMRLLGEGKAVLVGEWRGGKAERINYTDGKGQRAHFNRIVHSFEVGQGEQIKVTEPLKDDADVAAVVIPHKKGSRLVVVVEGMEIDRGNKTVRTSGMLSAG
jgi:hypothetical protein